MIHYRTMQPADIGTGLALCRAARWNQLQRDWELFLQLSPNGCRVAVNEERLIGTVSTMRYQDHFSWIGMVLVDVALRRQGIGSQLLGESLAVLRDEETIKLDATPAGREVYLKLGFIDEYGLSRMETVVSGQGLMESSARLLTAADWPAILEWDANVFGADRHTILEWLQKGAPEYAWVVEAQGQMTGYCFGRHGHAFEQLGPIIANDLSTAQHLVSACLREQMGSSFILDALHHNPAWLAWLEGIGFTEQRPFIRMYRGSNRYPGLPTKQFAILGPEFG